THSCHLIRPDALQFMRRRHPSAPLFPYTTLFRSVHTALQNAAVFNGDPGFTVNGANVDRSGSAKLRSAAHDSESRVSPVIGHRKPMGSHRAAVRQDKRAALHSHTAIVVNVRQGSLPR